MKLFAARGMQGVNVQLFDECGGTALEGSYQIDDRLRIINIVSEDTKDHIAFSSRSHCINIDQILDVVVSNEAIHHIEPGAWSRLSVPERERLVVLVYNSEGPESLTAVDCRKVCFLEADQESAKTFTMCIRILQRYFEDAKRPSYQSI
eukprot:s3304_g6.t1